ncbi:MAG: zinc-ribbon domain-containing protein, partial [Clostridia bacterium]|nr:zinc-ribbon domain-containing protein [Clostridia bacterium]
MKYCSQCGAKIEEGYSFCPGCGTALPKTNPQPNPGNSVVQPPQQNYYNQNQ